MKEKIKVICASYIMLLFAASPVLMLIMYITYTEKIICPILLITLLISGLTLYKLENE